MKILKNLVAITVISGSIFFVSCDNDSSADDNKSDTTAITKNEAEDTNDTALATKAAERNAEFLVDATASGYGEIKLAQLALQKSSNKELKAIASMLVADHGAVLGDIKTMASSKNITLPTEESSAAKDKLKDLSDDKASDFDKQWCETLMDNHKNSISKFENAANDVTDTDIKGFANTVLPKLRTHHDKLMECHKKLK